MTPLSVFLSNLRGLLASLCLGGLLVLATIAQAEYLVRNRPEPELKQKMHRLLQKTLGEAYVDDAALAKRLANDPQLAEQLSKNVKPIVNDAALAARLSSQVKPVVDDAALAARLSSQVKPVVDDEALAERLSSKVKPRLDEEKLAKRLSQRVKPQINEKRLADRLSRNIKPSPVDLNEEALAVALAIKLTEQEKLASLKVRKYPELLSQVEEANRAGDYEKTLQLLDEDLANRTPEEQRKALKISGIMSVLVGAKKMKRALSTIDDYDLPDDPELRQLQQSLDNWLQENLVME